MSEPAIDLADTYEDSGELIPAEKDTGEDNEALLRKFKKWFRQDSEHDSDWREKAYEDYGFVAGEEKQWDSKDIQALKDALRPIITFNRIDPLIRSVQGEQINNAQEIRFIPREMGDVKPNELLTSAAEWVRDQCDAADEESEAFWDMLICGKGWSELRIDLEDDPEEPNAKTERIDPFEMLADKNSRKRNYSDARRIWRIKPNIPIEDAREQYPGQADSDLDATWARLNDLGKIADGDDPSYEGIQVNDESSDGEGGKETVTIVQCQWWERKTFHKTLDPFTGQITTLPAEKHKELQSRVRKLAEAVVSGAIPEVDPMMFASRLSKDGGLHSVKIKKRIFRQAFIGRKILKAKDSPCPDGFTIGAITGFRDRNDGQWYGLVRAMKDPQRWANKWFSQTLHIMNTSAKGGVMMEEGAVSNVTQFKESWAKTDAVTMVPEGTLSNPTGAKIQPKPVSQFPQGFYQLMEFAISSIRDVTGINLEMLGLREAGQAASLEYQRRQAGITILAPLFKSMRAYYRSQGRVLLFFIQNYLSDGRLIRIVGEEGAKYVPLVRQADAKYDIVVDEGPTSPNQKERIWGLIGANFWNLPPAIQMALLEYSPFPSSVVEKVKQAAKQASEGPQAEMAQKMAELEAMLKQVEAGLKKAQTDKTQAETAQITSEIGRPTGIDGRPDQDGTMKALVDLTKAREGQAADMEKHREALGADVSMEQLRLASNAQMQREKMSANRMTEMGKTRMKAESDMMQTALREMFKPAPQPSKEA